METKRVLYFVDRLLWGGIQSLLYDIATHVDKSRVTIDVLTLDDGKHYDLEDRLTAAGTRVIQLKGVWNAGIMDFCNYIKAVNRFFKTHHGEYDAVHMNSSCKNVWILFFAKKYGVKIRIAHSHNTGFQHEGMLSRIGGKVLTPLLKSCATHCLACSENAGRWMFGDDAVARGKVIIIRNAIDTDAFVFHPSWRERLRRELGIDGKTVYGCVGRFSEQKNHKFLVEVFAEIKRRQAEAVLLLIGSGELEADTRRQVGERGLTNSVIFAGFKTNRNEYLSAMDAFIVPSTYEGFSIVTIEAQAAGLPCFVSAGVIPKEAKITDLITYISLDETAETWAKKIVSAGRVERKDMREAIVRSGCDMDTMMDTLTKIYES